MLVLGRQKNTLLGNGNGRHGDMCPLFIDRDHLMPNGLDERNFIIGSKHLYPTKIRWA